MKNLLLPVLAGAMLLSAPALSNAKSVSELQTIAQAGGSLLVEMDSHRTYLSVSDLVNLAGSLQGNATLTIRMDDDRELSTADCARIAKAARPGQVVFWFD